MNVVKHLLKANGSVPNNPHLPLLVYPGAVAVSGPDPAAEFERLFDANDWPAAWRNGIFAFHHYHSNAHEVLGIYSGEVTVCFGGRGGVTVEAQVGDVIVVPAGVGHKRIAARGSLGVVGGYPSGQSPDMCQALAAGSPRHVERVEAVATPESDPVLGPNGPLSRLWSNGPEHARRQ